MFNIVQSADYSWPVEVELASDAGRSVKQSFDARFRRITQTRVDEIAKQIKEGTTTDKDIVTEVMVGWAGVLSEKQEEVPFTPAALSTLLEIPGVASAIALSFLGSLSGAKRKN